jgi:succinate-acetate transporter protein
MIYEQHEQHSEEKSPDRAQVFLQPIAAPSILGLYAFAGATFMVSTNMAHWWGTPGAILTLMPFAAIFGGLAQFLAAMWAYKARDGVATAMHGMWGSFWMAYGLLVLLAALSGAPVAVIMSQSVGFWFIVLAAITWAGAAASLADNLGLFFMLVFLAAGSTAAAIAFLGGWTAISILAGWLLFVSSAAAWYTATALMLREAYSREVLPIGKSRKVKQMPPVVVGAGEPGVIRGQA